MIKNTSRTILVVNDVEATRQSIKEMLERDGYAVLTVRDEADAAEKKNCLEQIDLLLVSLEGEIGEIIAAAKRIRRIAGVNENAPIVIFCDGIAEKDESVIERGVYFSCPDDFNRLRRFIERLFAESRNAAPV